MPSLAETLRSLTGAARLFVSDAEGLKAFDTSTEGFFRSFTVLVLMAPIYLLLALSERSIIPVMRDAGADPLNEGVFFAVRAASYVADWFVYPILMVFVARWLGLTRNYAIFIVVRNWTSLPVLAAITLPSLLFAIGVLDVLSLVLLHYALFAVALRYSWIITSLALEASGWVAAALVALDFVVSLFIGRVADALIGL